MHVISYPCFRPLFHVTPGGAPDSPPTKTFSKVTCCGGSARLLGPAQTKTNDLRSLKNWVPEGSLAGFFGCRETALELVRGADFSWELMCRGGPGDLGGSRGSASAENPGKTGPKISSQTAFRYPAKTFSKVKCCGRFARLLGRPRPKPTTSDP